MIIFEKKASHIDNFITQKNLRLPSLKQDGVLRTGWSFNSSICNQTNKLTGSDDHGVIVRLVNHDFSDPKSKTTTKYEKKNGQYTYTGLSKLKSGG